MPYQTLLTELKEGIYTITINRPDKMNALNQAVVHELSLAVQETYENESIKSVLITGAGDKAFVAGADIAEFQLLSSGESTELASRGHHLFHRIAYSPKPFVAAVNGYALGGGCELAMACHFRLAAENARFGQPEVTLGLIPGYGGTQRLTALVGRGRALEMMMTGDMISARDAEAMGLVNHVVPPEKLKSACREILLHIQSKSPAAIEKIIACVNAFSDKQQDGFQTEIREFSSCFDTAEMKEGVRAFLEKGKSTKKSGNR